MSLKDFADEFKKGGQFISISKRGKVRGYVHPSGAHAKRTVILLNKVVENSKGERELRYVNRLYKGDEDPLSRLIIYLKETDTIDGKDVVLRYDLGKGKVIEITKADLLGSDGFDWKKRINTKTEFLFNFIDTSEGEDEPVGPTVLPVPFSAGKKLKKVWQEEADENGEVGDPWINPYPFRISFDKTESGSDMYSVKIWPHKTPSDEVKELFEEDPIDLTQYTDPDREDLRDGTTYDLLKEYCVINCPVFDTDVKEEGKKKATTVAKKEESSKPPKAKAKAKVASEKPAPTPPSKPGRPKEKAQSNNIWARKASKGGTYIYEDEDGDKETLTFVKYNKDKDKVIFTNEEGDRVKLKGDTQISIYSSAVGKVDDDDDSDNDNGESANDNEDTGDDCAGVKVKDCEVGKQYVTESGAVLQFRLYKSAKDVGVFKDSNGDKVRLDGDELVVLATDGDEDPLASRPKKKASKEPVVDTEPEATGTEFVLCPDCEGEVPISEVKVDKDGDRIFMCPHCKTGPWVIEPEDDVKF